MAQNIPKDLRNSFKVSGVHDFRVEHVKPEVYTVHVYFNDVLQRSHEFIGVTNLQEIVVTVTNGLNTRADKDGMQSVVSTVLTPVLTELMKRDGLIS